MTFKGTVVNGKIELERGSELPEGTEVRVEPVRKRRSRSGKATKPTRDVDPAFRLAELAIPMGITDLAAEHDHYLYGTPKRAKQARKATKKTRRPRKQG